MRGAKAASLQGSLRIVIASLSTNRYVPSSAKSFSERPKAVGEFENSGATFFNSESVPLSSILTRMRTKKLSLLMTAALMVAAIASVTAQNRPAAPTSLRLYVFDCGTIGSMNPASYDLKAEEIKGSLDFVTPCYLVVHPSGTLMWDVGQIPDANFPADGSPAKQGVFTSTKSCCHSWPPWDTNRPTLPTSPCRTITPTTRRMPMSLRPPPGLCRKPNATPCLVRRRPRGRHSQPATASSRMPSRLVVANKDHDVFGDGSVVIKFTPGHSPGHQSLFLKFAKPAR